MPFRCAYSLDGQGHDFSSSYEKKYLKKSAPVAIPVKRPEFKRCAYSLDAQGHELTYPKEYTSTSTTPTMSSDNSAFMMFEDEAWRAMYDLGQRPLLSHKDSQASTVLRTE